MTEKLYYSMGEVTEMFDVTPALVRYWCEQFPTLRPKRNAKGNRLFTKEDVEIFKQLHLLVKVEGLTLEGAAKRLKGEKKGVVNKARVLETLKGIRQQLEEIRRDL